MFSQIWPTWMFATPTGNRAWNEDLVIKTQIDPSALSALGLNPASTRIQLITAFMEAPVPQRTTVTNNGEAIDAVLKFADMQMPVGKAFLAQGNGATVSAGTVKKRWVPATYSQPHLLLEEIEFNSASNLLQNLPLHSSIGKPDSKIKHIAAAESGRVGSPSRPGEASLPPVQKPEFLLDYFLAS